MIDAELLTHEAARTRERPPAAPESSPVQRSSLAPSFDAWLHAKLHQDYLTLRERLASFDPDGRGLVCLCQCRFPHQHQWSVDEPRRAQADE